MRFPEGRCVRSQRSRTSSSWSCSPARGRASCCAAARRAPRAPRSPRGSPTLEDQAGPRSEGRCEQTRQKRRLVALVALGVTGGIGAYKAVEVARGLQKRGHDVAAVMTRSARRFVGEVTFEAITRRRVITTQWSPGANADIEHISLATDIACCWSPRRRPTSSASSPPGSPTISSPRCIWPRAPRCSWRRR